MRNVLFILGALLLGAGILMATGLFKYQESDKVADFGGVELSAQREKTAPLNWGYVLIGLGALSLVGGALSRGNRRP